MCRFALYLGRPITLSSLVTEPANSIIHQSYESHEGAEPLNGDGFGVAWYVPDLTREPAVFKDLSPAWNNANLDCLARVTRSACVLAHVRAATPGLPVTRLNCHPFTWGPFAFMHNGRVGGFKSLMRELRRRLSDEAYLGIEGSTDSEHVLALYRDLFARSEDDDVLERMVASLIGTIAQVEELRRQAGAGETSLLNLALTDGHRAVVTRYASDGSERANSLYVNAGERFACEDALCRMLPAGDANRAVLIASEPLTEDPGWRRVPPNHTVVVDDELGVELRPMEL